MILLCLDLSTKSTGYAVFTDGKLTSHGIVKPGKIKGISKMSYPEKAYQKIVNISDQLEELIREINPDEIVIEEVNRGINRISQKTLDALHFFVLDRLARVDSAWLHRVEYMDSNGRDGWRGKLGLRLSKEDKEHNAKARKHNKKHKIKVQIIDWKVLAQRYVNSEYGTDFDVGLDSTHADICDAIAMGIAHLKRKSSKK